MSSCAVLFGNRDDIIILGGICSFYGKEAKKYANPAFSLYVPTSYMQILLAIM